MRIFPLLPLTLALAFSVGGHAEIRPLCGRSHAYAVALLSEDTKIYDVDMLDFVGRNPQYVSAAEAAQLAKNPDYFTVSTSDAHHQTFYPRMQMGVGNDYGRWNTGLCWWHSRFHRSALYLMDFAPNRPKPNSAGARALMNKIAHFMPATIPGYDSLAAFTMDFPNELYSVLSDWEMRTTVYGPQNALGDWLLKTFTSAAQKKRIFSESAWNIVDDLATVPRPVFLTLDEEDGIHGILALSTREERSSDSVMLRYVDSNVPGGSVERTLLKGGEFAAEEGDFGFHPAFDNDFTEIQNGLRRVCGANYPIPRK